MKILIAGSTDFDDNKMAADAILEATKNVPPDESIQVICGRGNGVNCYIRNLVGGFSRLDPRWSLLIFSQDQERDGEDARSIRNTRMIDTGADICLAFLGLNSSNSSVKRFVKLAVKAKIPVKDYWSRKNIGKNTWAQLMAHLEMAEKEFLEFWHGLSLSEQQELRVKDISI